MSEINYNNLNFRKAMEEGLERDLNKTFIIYQHANGEREEVSYSQIKEEAKKLINKMKKAGLKDGDRVAVVSALRPFWYSLFFACIKQNYIMVCIDPGVPVNQMQKMMSQTEVRAVFTTLPKIHLSKELDGNIPVYSIEKDFPLISKCNKIDFLLSDAKQIAEDTSFILFSSGTTGENRKAVLLSDKTFSIAMEYGKCSDAGIYKNIPAYADNERDLVLFPPYHIAGLVCLTYDLYSGCQIIMLERLTPNCLMTSLKELKPDNICTVPSMLTSLYKKIVAGYSKNFFLKNSVNVALSLSGFLRKNFGINVGIKLFSKINQEAFGGNLKSFMIGASSFDKKANEFFLNMGINVVMAYGLTELGAPLTATGSGYYPGTAGRVVRHTKDIDIRIANKDKDGKGEVEVLSPYRMISYLKKKDNEGCFTNDGYFKTGDLGYFDKNDCLVICGRNKESIVLRNGEKLLPEEIESKYQNMNCVKEVCAFKVPGEGGCDDFALALINDKSQGIPDEAIKVRVYERQEKLPAMYRPKDVYVIKELPLSSTHKVQRFRLTEMVLSGQTEPVTDASFIAVDEDKTTASLRKMLTEVGGNRWKTEKLTQGTYLNLDSLSTVNLYVLIQDKWDIDLFQTVNQPETFGELLDMIKSYDVVEKNNKEEIDLSKYPLKPSLFDDIAGKGIEALAKALYSVKGSGLYNFPTDTNFIICPNHRTDIDAAFLSAAIPSDIMKKTCIVGKADIVNMKWANILATARNFIPIDRTGNSVKTLNRCKELLLEGWNIIIFPEGTSVQNNTTLFQLKEGPARLSIATGKPIIPAHITGVAHTDKEMSAFAMPSIKGKIKIIFGKPIYPKNMTPKELNEILYDAIQNL